MKKSLIVVVATLLAAGTAHAGGSHDGGHGNEAKTQQQGHGQAHGQGNHSHEDMMAAGMPGKASAASRVLEIIMLEKDDGSMVFEPAVLTVNKGETVRLKLINKGESDHEFVLDEHMANMKHKEAMAKYPDMEHADPNAIRLESGKSGEIIWTFSNTGRFEFACLIPGHYEAGMRGDVSVEDKTASN